MRHTGDGKGLRLKIFKRLVALQLILAGTLLAQGVDMEVVPTTEAQKMLKALIPHGKKFVAFNAYVAGTNVKDVKSSYMITVQCAEKWTWFST
jgi:hypothetical protein